MVGHVIGIRHDQYVIIRTVRAADIIRCLLISLKTRKDNSAAYTEPEVIEETVPDKVVIIDDSGIVHDSINCEKFSGTNARSISLEEALASGKKMCSKCLSEYYE